jgi:hypothetical protein
MDEATRLERAFEELDVVGREILRIPLVVVLGEELHRVEIVFVGSDQGIVTTARC